jgi:UDP-N-acetyl-alpha-D-muramoyl-L-alanyl-L-glutamate epimerase
MPPHRQSADRFVYEGYAIDPGRGEVRCSYSTGGHSFTERFDFGPGGDWDRPAMGAAVRLLFLLAGVSYYKTTAAPVIDLGSTATSAAERAFLKEFYVHGLGEFAYRNELDLRDLSVVGPESSAVANAETPAGDPPDTRRPLIPFGGGIDSLVTVAALRATSPDAALCIVHPPDERFDAIEEAAAATGLPIVRIARQIDPQVRRSAELGFLNGHVPITAVITAAALVAAVLNRRDAVVLSNEWSASVPTLVHDGQPVNHQWSKGMAFEEGFALLVASSLGAEVAVFSYLRCRSELWVAQQFAELREFHASFRSCNRSFHQDRAQRLDHWCGRCDKCCFIDLILSPFMEATQLRAIFGGHEPLDDAGLADRFSTLLGLAPDAKPFECVGDVDECRAALVLAAARPDRRDTALLQSLREAVESAPGSTPCPPAGLLSPLGPHYIPDRYAPPDLLVRAH